MPINIMVVISVMPFSIVLGAQQCVYFALCTIFNKQITAGAKPGELHTYVEKDSSEARVQCKQLLIKSNIISIKNWKQSKVSASSRILTANMLRVTRDKRVRVMHEKGGEVKNNSSAVFFSQKNVFVDALNF